MRVLPTGSRPRRVALDATAAALGDLMLGQGGQEAGGGPAFLVGLPRRDRPTGGGWR